MSDLGQSPDPNPNPDPDPDRDPDRDPARDPNPARDPKAAGGSSDSANEPGEQSNEPAADDNAPLRGRLRSVSGVSRDLHRGDGFDRFAAGDSEHARLVGP